jgi:hypothetical protein
MRIFITEEQFKVLNENVTDNNLLTRIVNSFMSSVDDWVVGVPKMANSFIDIKKVTDECKLQIKNIIVKHFNNIKTGKGSDLYIKDLFNMVYSIIGRELSSMNVVKRKSIQVLSGGRDKMLKNLTESDISYIIDLLESELTMGNLIGSSEYPYYDAINTFDNNTYYYIERTKTSMKTSIVNLIISQIFK